MALVNCKECEAQVSSTAKTCPTCGAKPVASTSYAWLLLLPVSGIIAFLGFGMLNSSPEKSKARAAIDYCWEQVDTLPAASTNREFVTKSCQRMVSSYESEFGKAPSLRRN